MNIFIIDTFCVHLNCINIALNAFIHAMDVIFYGYRALLSRTVTYHRVKHFLFLRNN